MIKFGATMRDGCQDAATNQATGPSTAGNGFAEHVAAQGRLRLYVWSVQLRQDVVRFCHYTWSMARNRNVDLDQSPHRWRR
jgi:hypothetical protein